MSDALISEDSYAGLVLYCGQSLGGSAGYLTNPQNEELPKPARSFKPKAKFQSQGQFGSILFM